MTVCIKIVLTGMFFDYSVSEVVNEIKRNYRLKKFIKIKGKTPNTEQIYEFLSRYSADQYEPIVNSIINIKANKFKKYKQRIIVDSTSVSVDINHINRFISEEKFKKLQLK